MQYLKLYRILKEGYLASNPEKPKGVESSFGVTIEPGAKLSENEMFNPTVVCFCDIPVEDLKIHTQKYGYCGLSFSKDFIASKSGCSILYIPKQTKAQEFDEMFPDIYNFFLDSIKNIPTPQKNSARKTEAYRDVCFYA